MICRIKILILEYRSCRYSDTWLENCAGRANHVYAYSSRTCVCYHQSECACVFETHAWDYKQKFWSRIITEQQQKYMKIQQDKNMSVHFPDSYGMPFNFNQLTRSSSAKGLSCEWWCSYYEEFECKNLFKILQALVFLKVNKEIVQSLRSKCQHVITNFNACYLQSL